MHFCTRPPHDVYWVHPSSELQRTQVWNVSAFCSKPVRSLKGCLVSSDKKKQVKKGESQVGGRKCGKSPWAMEMAKANWICVNYLAALSNGRGFKKKPGHAEASKRNTGKRSRKNLLPVHHSFSTTTWPLASLSRYVCPTGVALSWTVLPGHGSILIRLCPPPGLKVRTTARSPSRIPDQTTPSSCGCGTA